MPDPPFLRLCAVDWFISALTDEYVECEVVMATSTLTLDDGVVLEEQVTFKLAKYGIAC